MRLSRLPAALLCIALVTPAVSCSSVGSDSLEAGPPAIDVVAMAMDNGRKTQEIASDFPFQVPVLDGEVGDTEVLSPGSVWVYELSTPHSPVEVAEWYRRAYVNANWELEEEGQTRDAVLHGEALYFVKGAGAESVIEISDDGSSGTVVMATVALGAGIRQTY